MLKYLGVSFARQLYAAQSDIINIIFFLTSDKLSSAWNGVVWCSLSALVTCVKFKLIVSPNNYVLYRIMRQNIFSCVFFYNIFSVEEGKIARLFPPWLVPAPLGPLVGGMIKGTKCTFSKHRNTSGSIRGIRLLDRRGIMKQIRRKMDWKSFRDTDSYDVIP